MNPVGLGFARSGGFERIEDRKMEIEEIGDLGFFRERHRGGNWSSPSVSVDCVDGGCKGGERKREKIQAVYEPHSFIRKNNNNLISFLFLIIS